ncbi:MAG: hypothetical protein R3F50_01650 [Gammaproteobacteria bacterium]|jgi:hypothetical protein
MIRQCFAFLSILLLSACAMTGRAPLEPIAAGTRVQISLETAGYQKDPLNDDPFVLGAAATGAAGGALVGTLASISCGPFFYFCAPLAGGLGGAAGFVAGGILGAATAINREEQEAFNSIREAIFAERSLGTCLQDAFAEQAGGRWEVVSEHADRRISLRVDEFAVVQHSPDRFSLQIAGSFTAVSESQPDDDPDRYSHLTPARELDFFLDTTASNFREELFRAVDSLANQMINSL